MRILLTLTLIYISATRIFAQETCHTLCYKACQPYTLPRNLPICVQQCVAKCYANHVDTVPSNQAEATLAEPESQAQQVEPAEQEEGEPKGQEAVAVADPYQSPQPEPIAQPPAQTHSSPSVTTSPVGAQQQPPVPAPPGASCESLCLQACMPYAHGRNLPICLYRCAAKCYAGHVATSAAVQPWPSEGVQAPQVVQQAQQQAQSAQLEPAQLVQQPQVQPSNAPPRLASIPYRTNRPSITVHGETCDTLCVKACTPYAHGSNLPLCISQCAAKCYAGR